ncbi:MAG TPA: endonuclease/exonuclease/phosphatase family protein [Planctomycetota bacterium]|nr:endonuclease/exonuclease/phosphatase family protein [Planctomycetota bacterium]
MSWNVLTDANERERRLPALMAELRDAHPDVIAVQEATTWFAVALGTQPWAKDFVRVPADAEQAFPGGLSFFTSFQVQRSQVVDLPTGMARCGLLVEVWTSLGPCSFGVVHLDSNLEDGPMRSRQLRAMAAALRGPEDALLLGDFNFGDGEAESADLPAGFTDLWPTLHVGDAGFTWDIERSSMAKRSSFPGETSRRLDRVLVRSAHWQAAQMTLLGTAPVAGTDGQLFPSDHFGVRVVLNAR